MTPTPQERRQGTARELLETATAQLAPAPDANPFVPLVVSGTAGLGAVAALALEQRHVIPADRRSFQHLAARSAAADLPATAAFFDALTEGEDLAQGHLGALVAACGLDERQAAAYTPMAGCQAYPAYVAWLALNAEPVDAVLALTANFAAWGGYCALLARSLREHHGFPDEACAFFDLFAEPSADLDRATIAALSEGVAQGRVTPRAALRQGKLLQEYEEMFWASLAARV
ncbi:transcriptional regulator [Streptomyces sp. G45]|uniref:transcriptional regulator n=1 Tax=Streptomyces sp. G45 TaxID=3406627 RepID=UPI003C180929